MKKFIKGFAIHEPTGAKIPVIYNKGRSKYRENIQDRKGFTIIMLITRWGKHIEDVAKILQNNKIPAYINHGETGSSPESGNMLYNAIFFEEYIFKVERNLELPHNKLKSRNLSDIFKSLRDNVK